MASLEKSDDEENLALALRLSQLSSDDFVDEQFAHPRPEGSASANHIFRPRTPTNDDLAPVLRLSLLPSDEFDEQVARLHRTGSAFANEEVRSSTPPEESGEDNHKLALFLSYIFDEVVTGLNQRRESRIAIEGGLASLPVTMPPTEVRMTHSRYLSNY
jgi:hypothetical protein